MRCLQGSAVPVPKIYWLELNNKVLGAPFFVMGRVEGEVIDPQQFSEEPYLHPFSRHAVLCSR